MPQAHGCRPAHVQAQPNAPGLQLTEVGAWPDSRGPRAATVAGRCPDQRPEETPGRPWHPPARRRPRKRFCSVARPSSICPLLKQLQRPPAVGSSSASSASGRRRPAPRYSRADFPLPRPALASASARPMRSPALLRASGAPAAPGPGGNSLAARFEGQCLGGLGRRQGGAVGSPARPGSAPRPGSGWPRISGSDRPEASSTWARPAMVLLQHGRGSGGPRPSRECDRDRFRSAGSPPLPPPGAASRPERRTEASATPFPRPPPPAAPAGFPRHATGRPATATTSSRRRAPSARCCTRVQSTSLQRDVPLAGLPRPPSL